jgi:subtilisin family serine protease
MLKSCSSFSRIAAVGIALGVLALGSSAALAQKASKQYVLMADGGWGVAQEAAISGAGGTVNFRHAGSGIGVASSTDSGFLRKALASGAFSRGAEDIVVRWQPPVRTEVVEDGVVTPGDDRFINVLWNMQAIDAPGAWSLGYDGAGSRVAVIDGGMCSLHPDVAPNLDVAASRSFVSGFNWDDDTGGPTAFRHACHVAGIVAAADNTRGTIGVAPRATIIGVKALHNGSGSFGDVIAGILYAADPLPAGAGAQIINMSLGGTFAKGGGNTGAGPLVAAMNKAVNYASANNVLVVASAGNDAIDMDHAGSVTNVPAQSGTAIAISATAPQNWVGNPSGTSFDAPASYTNYGRSLVWVSAPGGDFAYPGNENCAVNLVSPPGVLVRPCWVFDGVLSPGSQSGSYFWASGTSMAAPHVSGVAALLVQKYPGISVGDLKNRIKNSATDAGQIGTDPFHGHGFLDAAAALSQ